MEKSFVCFFFFYMLTTNFMIGMADFTKKECPECGKDEDFRSYVLTSQVCSKGFCEVICKGVQPPNTKLVKRKYVARNTGKGQENKEITDSYETLQRNPYDSVTSLTHPSQRTDDEDTHKHVRRVLEIVDLFYFPGVTPNAVMLRVFPITLKGPALRWKKRLRAGCLRHDLNCQHKVRIFYTGLDIPTWKMLDSRGFIPLMTPTLALKSTQFMAEHSYNWYDETTTRMIPGTVYNDIYLGGKALVERENVGFDLRKFDLCPSFIEDPPQRV
ncbi:hypothetical protein Tco_1504017 [Tanacetum coccineum]